MKLSGFALNKFIGTVAIGNIVVDFDARTGHNHGTKFRFRNSRLHELYENVEAI
ncbi:PDDEXK family nuclease [Rickettsia australis]|uniref:MvaI/BcnI family restriction endonuclease n=1 Tax=Rickettsia australis TaxID=787 RepID=UPI000B1D77B9|nr:MvaI/BcnI family restriction endonuclease [Rickettsia australis]